GYEAGGVRVNCTSAGWYPPPQIEWRDARGQRISDEVVTEAVDPQGLYAASASVVLEEDSGEEVSCVIRNPLLGQERSAWLSIPGPFFRNTEPQMAFILPVLVPAMLLPVLLCLLWRRQRRNQAPSQEVEKPQAETAAAQAKLPRVGSAQEKLQDELRWTKRAGADHVSAPDLHLSLCSRLVWPRSSPLTAQGEEWGH
ncbi:butyrophilin subfamily 3 member A2-like, partial [Sturnira hondurensis]|uniref:butyrophilin subfamily 3 member A2-like n=1 Tax=Sturnira hondurensis TaxID=192404 RepID=UPI00187A77B4